MGAKHARVAERDAAPRRLPDARAPFRAGPVADPFALLPSLAMLAVIGSFAATATTGMTPLEALGAHIADPWHSNVGDAYVIGPTM